MVECCIYLVLLIVSMKVLMTMKHVIVGAMMEDVGLGHKIPYTITSTIVEKVLMVMGEVDIGLRPAPIHPQYRQACYIVRFFYS